MNRLVLGAAAALSVVVLVGLVYASSMDSGNFIPSNSVANTVITVHHRQAMVTCSMQPSTMLENAPVTCGSWSVALESVSNGIGNLSMATFSIGVIGANGIINGSARTVNVLEGISRRVCDHGVTGSMMPDMGIGVGHRCLFVTLESASPGASSAVVQLVGLNFTHPVLQGHGHDVNESPENDIESGSWQHQGQQEQHDGRWG
ncbi:MAG: hypothetical protein KGH94_03880 [Candidatus Micrarchaeota archaeon]|nr:hypothetical protein [Candidatus Micrarchaeota archaeon]